MKQAKFTALALLLGSAGLLAGAAHAQDKVKIGYISDMSSLYADLEGKGGATAIQMAIDDFGGKVLGKPIELLTVDHQNKADIAASKAREWIDTQNLTMIFSGTNSGVALALAKVAEYVQFLKRQDPTFGNSRTVGGQQITSEADVLLKAILGGGNIPQSVAEALKKYRDATSKVSNPYSNLPLGAGGF